MSARKVKTTKKQITKRSIAAKAAAPSRVSFKRAPMFLVQGTHKTRIPDDKMIQVLDLINGKEAHDEIISTQDAAELLNVSRPHVVKLIDEDKKLKAFHVGNQRRLYKKDVLAYKRAMRSNQLEALADLTKEAEDLDLDF